MSDWNVMYQLLLCANSTLITFGQLSFLKSDSTSCELDTKNGFTLQFDASKAFVTTRLHKFALPLRVWFQGPPSG